MKRRNIEFFAFRLHRRSSRSYRNARSRRRSMTLREEKGREARAEMVESATKLLPMVENSITRYPVGGC